MHQIAFLQPEMDAKYVYTALIAGRLNGVKTFLARKSDSEIEAIAQIVFVELGFMFAIKGINRETKGKVRALESDLIKFLIEVRTFRKEDAAIQAMDEGYPKYQASCVLLGRDPLGYHDWTDIQDALVLEHGR